MNRLHQISRLSIPIIVIFILNTCSAGNIYYLPEASGRRTHTGLEVFLKKSAENYRGADAVLISNHSGVDFHLNSTLKLLKERKINIRYILAPEHGLYGYQNEYADEISYIDPHSGIRIYNLHKLSRDRLVDLFKNTGIVIYDIQDMGMRCYTYISNLKETIDVLDGLDTELVILDRPNPTDFLGTDGAFLDSRFSSRWISAFPAPFLYGLTPGEAALYYSKESGKKINLRVIPMRNYSKSKMYNETYLPWIPPSPNLPSYESSIVYTAVVLFEGVNISIGRGTAKPFEYIGAPWINPEKLAAGLNSLEIENFRFKPVYFEPFMREYANEKCGGVHIFYTGGKFSPTEVSYKMTALLFSMYKQTEWKPRGNAYNIDYLAGTDLFRKFIDEGRIWEDYLSAIEPGLKEFRSVKKRYHLYR